MHLLSHDEYDYFTQNGVEVVFVEGVPSARGITLHYPEGHYQRTLAVYRDKVDEVNFAGKTLWTVDVVRFEVFLRRQQVDRFSADTEGLLQGVRRWWALRHAKKLLGV